MKKTLNNIITNSNATLPNHYVDCDLEKMNSPSGAKLTASS
jgi:hypothetical protein